VKTQLPAPEEKKYEDEIAKLNRDINNIKNRAKSYSKDKAELNEPIQKARTDLLTKE